MKIAVFSIATYSKLGEAKVLLDSVLTHAPWAQTFIFLAEKNSESAAFEHSIVTIEALGIKNLNELAFQYDCEEFIQALKPWALEYLLKNFDAVIYFDASIEVFSSLSEIFNWIPKYKAMITPMITSSVPNDGLFPSYTDILRVGQFHSGFFCMRSCVQIKNFLEYWKEEVQLGLAIFDPLNGWIGKDIIFSGILSFVDDVKIIRNNAYHFSVWNAFQRNLSENEGNILTSDGPLVFLNFQGLDRKHENKLGQKRWVYRNFLPSTKKLRPFLSSKLVTSLDQKHKIKKRDAFHPFKNRSHAYTFGYYDHGDPIFYNDRKIFLQRNTFEKKIIGDPFVSLEERIPRTYQFFKAWKKYGTMVFLMKCFKFSMNQFFYCLKKIKDKFFNKRKIIIIIK